MSNDIVVKGGELVPQGPRQKEYMVVDAAALIAVVKALNGPEHHIRELMATRDSWLTEDQPRNPINVLTEQVQAQQKFRTEEQRPEPTSRGFNRLEFKDRYGLACSLQMSSAAMFDAVWLGVESEEARPIVPVNGEWKKVDLPEAAVTRSRMHLDRQGIADLLPHLLKFLATGEI